MEAPDRHPGQQHEAQTQQGSSATGEAVVGGVWTSRTRPKRRLRSAARRRFPHSQHARALIATPPPRPPPAGANLTGACLAPSCLGAAVHAHPRKVRPPPARRRAARPHAIPRLRVQLLARATRQRPLRPRRAPPHDAPLLPSHAPVSCPQACEDTFLVKGGPPGLVIGVLDGVGGSRLKVRASHATSHF